MPALYSATTPAAERGKALWPPPWSMYMKPPSAFWLRLDVFDAAIDRLARHEQAGVARGTQGHDLANRHRNVGVASLRLIAPAPFAVLRVDDQVDRLGKLFADVGPHRHAVGLGQKQRGEAVAVHRAVAAGVGHVDEPALLRIGQDEVDAAIDVRPVGTASGRAAGRHERHAGQPANGHVAAIAAGAKRAFVVLPAGQQGQAPVDGACGGGRDQVDGRFFRVGLCACQPRPGAEDRQGGDAVRKKSAAGADRHGNPFSTRGAVIRGPVSCRLSVQVYYGFWFCCSASRL